MPDDALVNRNSKAAPKDYVVPGAQEFVLKAAAAAMDGSASTGAWQPALQLISPAGDVMWTACLPTVAAAGSANVSWFPGGDVEEAQASGVGVIVETLLVDSRVEAGITASTVLASGQQYVITAQGTISVWNTNLGTGTPNADAMFPTSPPPARASTQVGLDPECAFAVQTGGGTPLGHGPFLVANLGSGFQSIIPQDGTHATPAPNYLYTYKVTGQGHAPIFKANDQPGQFSDNYGYFQVTIQTLNGQSSGGGGSGSLVPPDGSSQSLLRAVSNVPTWAAQPNISEADFTFTDITTANSTTAQHGLLRKLDNNSAHFMDGTGGWSTPTGSGTISDITSTGASITVGAPTGPTTNVDVAASGVAAATYGDSTHVAQFHVGADGRVTSASSVAISGSGGAGGLIVLFDSGYLGADAASIDTGAGGIAGGHFCLIVFGYLRTSAAVVNDNVVVTWNNDSGANYDFIRTQNSAGTVAGSTGTGGTSGLAGTVPGANDAANNFGSLHGWVPAYDGTTNKKSGRWQSDGADATAANSVQTDIGFCYRSTSAISRLKIASNTGGANLKAGSRLIIYGAQ